MELIFRAVYAKERGNRPAALAKTWSAYGDLWIELIRSGVKGGEFDARLDPKLVASAMLGTCNTLSTWYDPYGEVSVRDLTRNYFSVFAFGVTQRRKPSATLRRLLAAE